VLEVPNVDWAEALTYPDGSHAMVAWRAAIWEKTLSFVKKVYAEGGLDLFLGYLYPSQIDVGAIRELQRKGIPCVNFFCDNVREFRSVPPAFSSFDLHWVPEFEALPIYRQANLPYIHAPMPCWVPKCYRSVSSREHERTVFIGSSDLLRRNLLGEAMEAGTRIRVYGKGWQTNGVKKERKGCGPNLKSRLKAQRKNIQQHGLIGVGIKIFDKIFPPPSFDLPKQNVGGLVSRDDYVRLTRESAIVLGINRVPCYRRPLRHPLRYSRLRDIEAPMLGSCYLTEFTEGLSSLYDVGVEVETYRSVGELSFKINELLSSPSKRSNLRLHGQRRALGEHSIPSTLKKICKRLGLGH
jgi:hypothetical protein